ncbi:NAD(P)H-hydrate dehydratase [Gallaecimonas sp. GXIMD4217]|uniref:NAD(P)H-hydrate dehydratase n=1 Tax=Gallaecimonas sp. GXIMD4217 TaxID=3131927 RepID=UPI00311AC3E3
MKSLLHSLPQPLLDTARLKTLEPVLARRAGISLFELMSRAGHCAYEVLLHHWPDARRLMILAGQGNNGGDAYVLASLALHDGLEVSLYRPGPPKTEDAKRAEEGYLALGGHCIEELPTCWQADLVVDGLLGTGLASPLREPLATWQAALARCPLPVLALDLPSGLDADSGAWQGQPWQAEQLVTFILPKVGLLTGQGRASWRQASLASLGMKLAADEWPALEAHRLASLQGWLRPPLASAHKGHNGLALLVGGNLGMSGAIRLAGEAALRSGAGMVRVLTHPGSVAAVSAGRPELMVLGLADPLGVALPKARVLVLGPGLGQDDWAQAFFSWGLSQDGPKVLDADALNLLARSPGPLPGAVLTPHPGEAARLLGISTAEVEADRLAAVAELARTYQAVVVLKGAGTLVSDGQQSRLLAVGGPAMASGGMGDLLSGIIGALLAQGLPQWEAACLGVALHGEAGELAGEGRPRGTLASDLLPFIRRLVNNAELEP